MSKANGITDTDIDWKILAQILRLLSHPFRPNFVDVSQISVNEYHLLKKYLMNEYLPLLIFVETRFASNE
jgi:hypothetical protein